MNHANRMLNALTYQGPSRLKKAWLGAVATYTYTRAHDGSEIAPGEYITFSRWYSFKAAVSIFWEWLRRPR